MRKIAVDGLSLTRAEAVKLIQKLQRGIELFDAAEGGNRRTYVTSDGYMTLQDFEAFFAPIYPERKMLSAHATKLFNRLVVMGRLDAFPLKVLCVDCGQSAVDANVKCVSGFSHDRNYPVKIDVKSLKKIGPRFMREDIRNVGPAMIQDLQLLLDDLRS